MTRPLERANRANELTKKLNEETRLEAEIKSRRANLQTYLSGPPEEDPEQQQYEAALANLDGEEAEEMEIQAKEGELASLRRAIEGDTLQVYTDRLVNELERFAQLGRAERQEHIKWLRTRIAWTSTAILGAVITLAANGKLDGDVVDQAALHAIWYSGIAIGLAAGQRILLTLFYLGVDAIAFAANRSVKYAKAAPVVSSGMAASAWLPVALLAAEIVFMAYAAWNLAIILNEIIRV